MLHVTDEQAKAHYAEHEGKPFYPRLIRYIQSGPIVAMVVQGYNAVAGSRHIMGSTNPDTAEVGTIRADFAQLWNIILYTALILLKALKEKSKSTSTKTSFSLKENVCRNLLLKA